MFGLFFSVGASVLAYSVNAIETSHLRERSSEISWGPCLQTFETAKTYNTTLDCGNLTVPLDYSDLSKGTIDLNLLRAHAPKGPSQGSVLVNYGGPGEPGRRYLVGALPWGLTLTGFVHDLVIFDPRGTVDTIPMICYNATEYPGNSQVNNNASDTASGEIWNRNRTIGPYMGTAAVARDLMSVVDALNEDGLLRYYSTSYGTTLGATVAAMFPDRMDKLYLDGVVNSHEYYHSIDMEAFSGLDKLWSEFFVGCVEAPFACPLAKDGKTAQELELEFYAWLYHRKHEPFSTGITDILTYTAAKILLLPYTYQPSTWPYISRLIDAAQRGDATLYNELYAHLPANPLAGPTGQGAQGIKCSDKTSRTETLDAWLPQAQRLQETSRAFGDTQVNAQAVCARWKMPAVEIYQGDFQVKTRNPILFASNEFDPITPLVSAYNMSSGFESSFLLVNKNGHGHTTRRQPSACILENVSNYFLTGALPASGTVCEPSSPLFGNVTEQQVLRMVNGSN